MVNTERRFGTTCRSYLQGSRVYFVTLEDMTDTLFRNVGKKLHYTLRNIPEERRSSYSLLTKRMCYYQKDIHIIPVVKTVFC